MVGSYRPAEDGYRRASDFRDRSRDRDPRDRDARDRDLRDRSRDRDRYPSRRNSFSRERERDDSVRSWDRNREARPNHTNRELFNSKPNRAATKRTNSAQSSPAHKSSDQGRNSEEITKHKAQSKHAKTNQHSSASIISNMSFSDGNPSKQTPSHHVKRATDIICKKLHWYSQREDVVQKQKILQEDIKRFESRRSEFASLHSTHERQLESLNVHKKSCTQHVESADQELLPAFVSLVNSLCDTRESPSQPMQTRSQESHTKDMGPDLEPRLMALQKATADSFKIQMALELNKLRQELKIQYDAKVRALEESLGQETQQRQLLKTRLDLLSQKVNSDKEESIQTNSKLDERITKRLDEVSQTLDNNKAEATKERGQIDEQHGKRTNNQVHNAVANCQKRVDEVNSRITALESDVPGLQFQNEQNAELHSLLEKQSQKVASLQGQVDAALEEVKVLKEGASRQGTEIEQASSKLKAIEDNFMSLKEDRERDATLVSLQEDIEQLRTKITGHAKIIKAQEEKQDLAIKDISLLNSKLSGLPMDDLKQLPLEIPKIKQKLESYSSSPRTSPALENQAQLVTKKVLQEFQVQLEQRHQLRLKKIAEGIAVPVQRVEEETRTLGLQAKSLDAQVNSLEAKISANEQTAGGQLEKHNRYLSDFDTRLQQQIDENKAQDTSLAWVKSELEMTRQEMRLGHEDLQMQLGNLNGWVSNFNSQSLYDNMTNRVYQSISKGVPALVEKLSARVEVLESLDEGPLSKKRKASNGDAVAVNGNH